MTTRMRPIDFVRMEGALAMHRQIKLAVESIRGADWHQDMGGVEWVRMEAVRLVIDQAEPFDPVPQ